MLDFISSYLTSLAEFWGTAIRIGLPQLLLVLLLICWIRRKRCARTAEGASDKSCCGVWTWGTGCSWCQAAPCGCTCGGCRCQTEEAQGGDEDGDS